jgi:hypothetical protein
MSLRTPAENLALNNAWAVARGFPSYAEYTAQYVAGKVDALGHTVTNAANTVANGVTDVANKVGDGATSVGSTVGNAVEDGWNSVFCHTAGTLIAMSDGSTKPVEQLVIGDDVLLGGKVTGRREVPSTDFYSYRGTVLTGGHAVFEDGVWLRVEHSQHATRLEDQSSRMVYPMWTENHLLVCEQYICSDFAECDGGIGDDPEGLAIKLGMLNDDTTRNRELSEMAERFGLSQRRAA